MTMFYDSFGLINAHPDERNGENALLYTVEHFFMCGQDGWAIENAIQICRTEKGIFLQNPSNRYAEGSDMYMSHDQSTALMLYSWFNDLPYHLEMWEEMKRQWFFYDNINPPRTLLARFKNRRPIHPRDVILYGNLCGCVLWKLLLPVLWTIMLMTALKKWKVRPHGTFPALDGKCLNFIRLVAQKDKSLAWKLQWHLHTWLMNRNWGGWKGVFSKYFPYPNHPNVVDFKG